MATITPHRDGVEEGLRRMRELYAAMPTAANEADRATRAMTMTFQEAALLELADARDRGIPDRDIANAVCTAVAGLLVSFCATMAGTDPDATNHNFATAMRGIFLAGRAKLEDHSEDLDVAVVEVTKMGRA